MHRVTHHFGRFITAASSRLSSPDIVSGLNLLEADAVLVGVVKPGLGRLESGGARVKGEAAAAHSGDAVGPTECRARRRECEQEAKVIAYWPAGKGGLATESAPESLPKRS